MTWKRRMPGLAILLLLLLALPPAFGPAQRLVFRQLPAVGAITYSYYLLPDDGTITTERCPPIRFGVSTGAGGPGLSSIRLELDGTEVPLQEETPGLAYSYQPPSALSPGIHRIRVRYSFAGYQAETQTASFTVAASVIDPFADGDPATLAREEAEALATLNCYRAAAGLLPLVRDPALSRSAQAHSNYLAANPYFGHAESSGSFGFTGVNPWDRAAYFGYFGSVGEGCSAGDQTAVLAIDALLAAPYHRLGLLNPNYRAAGIGFNGGEDSNTVANYGFLGSATDDRVVLYPYPGQTDARIGWYALEDPNPLASYGQDRIYTGYPISFSVHDALTGEVQMQEASLQDAYGRDIPCYLVDSTREKDRATHVFLIPRSPLRLGMTYTARVRATRIGRNGEHSPLDRQWSFATLDDPAIVYAGILQLNGSEYVTLRLQTGELADLTHTLYREGKTYQSYNTKGDRYYTRYLPLTNGRYTLEVNSGHLGGKLTATVEVAGSAGSRTLQILGVASTGPVRVRVDGVRLPLDVPPLLVQGRTLVPLRAIFTALGIELQWDEASRTVTGRKGAKTIVLPVDRTAAMVNGRTVTLDVPARIVDGRTLVPTRWVAESTGAAVDWEESSRTVLIISPN